MTCKDCVGYDFCDEIPSIQRRVEKQKNKADFVEVVRCKDYKHEEKTTKFKTDCTTRCGLLDKAMVENDFCSHGQRK